MKYILILLFPLQTIAQKNDFISFKKKDRTVKHYFANAVINFVHINGAPVSGTIKQIVNDTLYLQFAQTGSGMYSWDTLAVYDARFHYKEIGAFPKPDKGFEFIRNGMLFKILGAGYGGLHLFNGIVVKGEEGKMNPWVLGASAATYGLGIALKKSRKYYYVIGKKYKVEYIKIADHSSL